MKTPSLRFTLSILLFALSLSFLSCKKKDGVTPVLNVNQLNDDVVAGDIVNFDINASGVYSIVSLKVNEDFNEKGNIKTLMDSTLKTSKSYFTYVFRYTVPANATKGEKSNLTFTVKDTKGHTTSTTRTVNIKSSQPILKVSADKNTAPAGGTVALTIDVNSSDANLGNVEIRQTLPGQQTTSVTNKSWTGQTSIHWTYDYTVPSGASKGQEILLLIVAGNSDGGQRYQSVKITVQ